MRFLIVGCGSIGRRHLLNLRALGYSEIDVYSRDRLRGEALERELEVRAFYDLDEALGRQPDTVFITNPTALHAPAAMRAAQAGCHLFIEKPLSGSLEGIEALSAEVKRRRLVAMVGYNLRFHVGLQRIKQTIEAQKIGRVLFARAQAGQYLPDWRPGKDYRCNYSARAELGGGVVLDLSHEIDYLYWLFGPAASVTAAMKTLGSLAVDVEDFAALVVEFRSGPHAEIHLDCLQPMPQRDCQIVGEEGALSWDYYAGTLKLKARNQGEQDILSLPNYDRNEMYLGEIKHFLACTLGREEPLISIDQGRDVLALALAAKESARQQRTVYL